MTAARSDALEDVAYGSRTLTGSGTFAACCSRHCVHSIILRRMVCVHHLAATQRLPQLALAALSESACFRNALFSRRGRECQRVTCNHVLHTAWLKSTFKLPLDASEPRLKTSSLPPIMPWSCYARPAPDDIYEGSSTRSKPTRCALGERLTVRTTDREVVIPTLCFRRAVSSCGRESPARCRVC